MERNITGQDGNDANSGNTPVDPSNDVTFGFKSDGSSQYNYVAGDFNFSKVYSRSYLLGFIQNQIDRYNAGRTENKSYPASILFNNTDGSLINWGSSDIDWGAYNAGYSASNSASYWGADFYNLTNSAQQSAHNPHCIHSRKRRRWRRCHRHIDYRHIGYRP